MLIGYLYQMLPVTCRNNAIGLADTTQFLYTNVHRIPAGNLQNVGFHTILNPHYTKYEFCKPYIAYSKGKNDYINIHSA